MEISIVNVLIFSNLFLFASPNPQYSYSFKLPEIVNEPINKFKNLLFTPPQIDLLSEAVPNICPPRIQTGTPDISTIRFILYNKKHQNVELRIGDLITLVRSYNPNAEMKILIHGYNDGFQRRNSFVSSMRQGYQSLNRDINIILVDWAIVAQFGKIVPDYNYAASSSYAVGQHIARFIRFIIQKRFASLKKIHIIGHSLGAQVAGIVGYGLTTRIGKPSRITGLDPAFPCFQSVSKVNKLDATDAEFVDVIHTDGGLLIEGGFAFVAPIGTVDFYPNGGKVQPGCNNIAFTESVSCPHNRSYKYMVESLTSRFGFAAKQCNNWLDYQSGVCNSRQTAYMGEYVSRNARGKFYLQTNSKAPYAIQ